MSSFQPMVKMTTTEPSVILKLKKGGKVKSQEPGFAPMSRSAPFKMKNMPAEEGRAPKKPSAMERRRAMNPNFKKGGKVAHKFDGGAMAGSLGSQTPVAPSMAPMGAAAIGNMDQAQRAARMAALRRALTGMKKGGSADAKCAALEKELKRHESLSAAKAHKAKGGAIKGNVGKFANTKMDTTHRTSSKGATKGIREGAPAGYAMGGTIEGNEGPFKNTKMVTMGKSKSGGATGGVRMSNAGGYKDGGSTCWENRAADTSKPGKTNTTTGGVKKANAGGYRSGGMASKKAYAAGGNVVDDGKAEKYPRKPVSRPVANSLQSGTFKRGGKVGKYAEGGDADDDSGKKRSGYFQAYSPARMAQMLPGKRSDDGPSYSETAVDKAIASSNRSGRKIGKKEGKAIHSLLKGRYAGGGKVDKEDKPNLRLVKTHSGPKGHVAKVYKDRDWDEYRVKFFSPEGKHLPNADHHTDDLSDANDTANSQVNKGYKRGGKVRKFEDGGSMPLDIENQLKDQDIQKSYSNWEKARTEENIKDAQMIPNAMRRAAKMAGSLLSSKPPAGSITKTERSTTVTPAKVAR